MPLPTVDTRVRERREEPGMPQASVCGGAERPVGDVASAEQVVTVVDDQILVMKPVVIAPRQQRACAVVALDLDVWIEGEQEEGRAAFEAFVHAKSSMTMRMRARSCASMG